MMEQYAADDVMVAFSGGVDSALLLKLACEAANYTYIYCSCSDSPYNAAPGRRTGSGRRRGESDGRHSSCNSDGRA